MKSVVAGPRSSSLSDLLADLDVRQSALVESLAGGAAVDVADLPLRLAIASTAARLVTGHLLCGRLAVGDEVIFSPSHLSATVTALKRQGALIAVTLDQPVAVEGGELASHFDDLPQETDVFRATALWLDGSSPDAGLNFILKLHGLEMPVEIQEDEAGEPGLNELIVRTPSLIALDEYERVPPTGRFVLLDGDAIAAVGVIGMEGYPDQRGLVDVKSTNVTEVKHRVSAEKRAAHNGHRGGVLWFTGLSGSGKSTLAIEVEQRLFRLGYQAYVLDGDNMRRGLNANLGFSPDDRAENIRRVGQVAAMFADAGFLVISAFISPYLSDRTRARVATEDLGTGRFHEMYIYADLEECERRDPKGLYKRARSGEIADFTGISAPYEAPENPDMVIDTVTGSIDDCAKQIVDYIVAAFVTP